MKQVFTWQAENVAMPDIPYGIVDEWLQQVAANHGRIATDVNYLFCDDAHILEVNRQFLQHDYYTDIITFDRCRGRILRGDIVLSLDTVATNSQLVSAAYKTELYRVIVHGLLHLCGIDDKAPGARAVMESHENEALDLLRNISPDLFDA